MTMGVLTSNTPVPVGLGRPNTIFPDGEVKSSKSPYRAASFKKAAVVSYDALSRGEELVEIPLRLNGLYPPSKVYKKWDPSVQFQIMIAKCTM
jgi:hypothetical protein